MNTLTARFTRHRNVFFLSLIPSLFWLSQLTADESSPPPHEDRYKLQAWLISLPSQDPDGKSPPVQTEATFENPLTSLLGKADLTVETLIELTLIEGSTAEHSREHLVRPIGSLMGQKMEDLIMKVGEHLSATLIRKDDDFQLDGLRFSSSKVEQWLSFGEDNTLWVPTLATTASESRITLKAGQSIIMSGLRREGKSQVIIFRLLDTSPQIQPQN